MSQYKHNEKLCFQGFYFLKLEICSPIDYSQAFIITFTVPFLHLRNSDSTYLLYIYCISISLSLSSAFSSALLLHHFTAGSCNKSLILHLSADELLCQAGPGLVDLACPFMRVSWLLLVSNSCNSFLLSLFRFTSLKSSPHSHSVIEKNHHHDYFGHY